MNNNPLSQYFRRPAIHIRLPSNGNGYPPGSLELTESGELPVYPMTAVDEVTYRTPDALFNGSAVVDVINSCIPNIKNPWQMPIADLDTVLISIRIASYGSEMPFETVCPNCSERNEFEIDLHNILEGMKAPDYQTTHQLGDLEIKFHSLSYTDINKNNVANFEQQKMMSLLEDADMSEEEKLTRLGAALKSLTAATMHTVAQSIEYVRTDEATVSDQAQILEWLQNMDRKTYSTINDLLLAIKEDSQIKPLAMTCPECNHNYDQPFTLDMSNFFGDAS